MLVDLGGNGATTRVRAEYGYAPGGGVEVLVVKPLGLDGVLLLDPLIGSIRASQLLGSALLPSAWEANLNLLMLPITNEANLWKFAGGFVPFVGTGLAIMDARAACSK